MPNLVVYVPADVARALEVKGVSQDVQRRVCNEVLYGLAENGLVAGGDGLVRPLDVVSTAGGGVTDTAPVRESRVSGGSGSPGGLTSPLSTSVKEFKGPDPKKPSK